MSERPHAAPEGPDSATLTEAGRILPGSAGDGAVAVAPEEMRAIAEAVRQHFPRPLAEPELVLIDVDPHRIHAFWNLPSITLEAARAALPEADGALAPLVVRLRRADGGEPFDTEVQGLQGQTYIDVWDDARLYEADLGLRRGDGSLHVLIHGNSVRLPNLPPAAADVPLAPTPDAAAVETAAPVAAVDGGSSAAAEEQPQPLALETVLTLSSHVLGRETVQFEVNAELHIFGRARPGSELRLFGRRVALRPDGTFSINRPLPHGALVLSALLAGGDGD